jgi:hypothetical protein
LLSGCSSSGSATATAPTAAAAHDLLARHAHAVLTHSAPDYLADVDTATSAAAFRAQEQTDITNLAGVPLASWTYADQLPVRDPRALAAASKRYGTPALILQVTLRYALRYVDPLPDRHDLFLTFVRRDGKVVLSGDNDMSTSSTVSWVGPWRFGPLVAARGASSLVLGPATASLRDVAAAVDGAVARVSAVWGTHWNRQVAVLVTGSDAAFSAAVGAGEQVEDVSAAAVTGGIDPVTHDAYGQRLVLAPSALTKLSAVGEQIVLRHEITHLATATITDRTTPRWVVEGFAEYVANLDTGQPVADAASELRAAVRAGRLPTALPDDTAFAETGAALARAYEGAWLACRLIAARAGQGGLVNFYRTAAGALLPAAQALAQALTDAVHESVAAFTAQWRTYLKSALS